VSDPMMAKPRPMQFSREQDETRNRRKIPLTQAIEQSTCPTRDSMRRAMQEIKMIVHLEEAAAALPRWFVSARRGANAPASYPCVV
jgi:hypothetical protein